MALTLPLSRGLPLFEANTGESVSALFRSLFNEFHIFVGKATARVRPFFPNTVIWPASPRALRCRYRRLNAQTASTFLLWLDSSAAES